MTEVTEAKSGNKKGILDSLKLSSSYYLSLFLRGSNIPWVEEELRSPENDPVTQNILKKIIRILEKYRMSREGHLLENANQKLKEICPRYHLTRRKLVEMGILSVLSDIMTKEAEKQMRNLNWSESFNSKILLKLISGFLSDIKNPDYYDLNTFSNYFLYRNANHLEITKQECEIWRKQVFPELFKICQILHCPNSYKLLLLKFIYSAIKTSSDLVKIEEIVGFTKKLINKRPIQEENIAIGFAFVDIMLPKYSSLLIRERVIEILQSKKSLVLSWHQSRRFKIFSRVFYSMPSHWLSKITLSKNLIDEEVLDSRIDTINSILNRILPDIDDDKASQINKKRTYHNLRETVKDILNLPDITRHKGKLIASPEGIRKFKDLVVYIIKTVEALIIRNDVLAATPDLCDIEKQSVPKSPNDIRLELYRSASFDRVLGSSQSPEELRTDPLVRALRLLSILYEVNENWGILFGTLSTERLIHRNYFVSKVLREIVDRTYVNDEDTNTNKIPPYLGKIAQQYIFLIFMNHRHYLVRSQILLEHPLSQKAFYQVDIPRKNVLNELTKVLESAVKKSHEFWGFQFCGELGAIMGSTKEFYFEFSRDCQRFSRGLWSGEARKFIDGVSYVKSQAGLFPPPKSLSNPMSESYLNAIGVVMAKAVIDFQILDIHFSDAFYKCLFKKNLDAQQLSLIDIKDVMPSIFKFVESLVDALREKWCIRNDCSLTTEEQDQAISNITCDGSSFEDLCLNFTLPGFPSIEMMENGSETLLTIENLEDYLKLIIWWLLYDNPQKSIKEVRSGIERIINTSVIQYFYPHEYEQLFCGMTKEEWTVDLLKKNCKLEDLSFEAPVIQYLFEVLSSLSADDQRNFLQFVTASPRLPVGGLVALYPLLTISNTAWADGSPDNYLPRSLTCHNMLFISKYSCKEALEEKLLLAIREGRNVFSFI